MNPEALLKALEMRRNGKAPEEIAHYLLQAAGMKTITAKATQAAITGFETFITELDRIAARHPQKLH